MSEQKQDIDSPEIVYITESNTFCDGKDASINPALGHPRVYLTINKNTQQVDCPYCDRRFTLRR